MSFELSDFSYSRQRPQISGSSQSRHFTIRVGNQMIGLPVDCVKTIFNIETLTPVPLAPAEVAGLTNLRGRIVTALHLDKCLNIDSISDEMPCLAVGIELNGEDYALLIDEAGDVVVNYETERIDCPAHIDARLLSLISACYRYDDGFLSVVDIAAMIRHVSQQGALALRDGRAKNSTRGINQ